MRSSPPSLLIAFLVIAFASCVVSAPPEIETEGEPAPARRELLQQSGEEDGGGTDNFYGFTDEFYGLTSPFGDDPDGGSDGGGGAGDEGGGVPDGGYPLFASGYPTATYLTGTNAFTFAGALDRPGAVFFVAVRQPNGLSGGATAAPTPEEIFAGNASANAAGANGISAAADGAGQLSVYTAGTEESVVVGGLQDLTIYDVYVATHSNPDGRGERGEGRGARGGTL